MKTIRSRFGFVFYFWLGFPVCLLAIFLWLELFPVRDPEPRAAEDWLRALAIYAGLVGMIVYLCGQKVEVSRSAIVVRGRKLNPAYTYEIVCRNAPQIPFSDHMILFAENHPLRERRKDENNLGVWTFLYANRDELVKAIMEATYLENPEVHIPDELLSRHGRPPFGIFGQARAAETGG